MENQFIPYEQALELKELGFDEECLDKYDPRFEKLSSDMETWTSEHYPETLMIPAPLYQQAFRWFREKYLDILVKDYGLIPHFTIIQNMFLYSEFGYSDKIWTYEEAELACLKKLIEIVKNK